jgi:hypothetical protein
MYGGTRDDNDGFYFGWFDLLALRLQSILITLKYKRYRYSTHFQFNVAHALGFSVSTSRLLATDLNTETSTSSLPVISSSITLYSSVPICIKLIFIIHLLLRAALH